MNDAKGRNVIVDGASAQTVPRYIVGLFDAGARSGAAVEQQGIAGIDRLTMSVLAAEGPRKADAAARSVAPVVSSL